MLLILLSKSIIEILRHKNVFLARLYDNLLILLRDGATLIVLCLVIRINNVGNLIYLDLRPIWLLLDILVDLDFINSHNFGESARVVMEE